jgi:hypothetical protein
MHDWRIFFLLAALLGNPILAQGQKGTFDPAVISCGGAPVEECPIVFVAETSRAEDTQLASTCAFYTVARADQEVYFAQLPDVLGPAHPKENAPADECRIKNLSPAPAWAGSATWNPGGDAIIVSDQVNQELSVYSSQGSRRGQVPRLKGSPEIAIKPALIQANNSGYILEHQDGNLLFLNQSLNISRSLNLLEACKGSSGKIGAAYSWTSVGDDLLVVGDIDKGEKGWSTDLVWVRPNAPSDFKSLNEMSLEDPSRVYYHIGLPYLTHIGPTGYFLLMNEVPEVYKITDSSTKTKTNAINKLGFRRPNLPKISGAHDYPKIYAALEKASMPAGLYGWKGLLFLLIRKPSRTEGQTDWSLVRIDPIKDVIVGNPLPLPTKSPHLLIAPGPKYWAIIEKGVYRGVGDQNLGRTILFPSSWIEAGAPPGPYECR